MQSLPVSSVPGIASISPNPWPWTPCWTWMYWWPANKNTHHRRLPLPTNKCRPMVTGTWPSLSSPPAMDAGPFSSPQWQGHVWCSQVDEADLHRSLSANLWRAQKHLSPSEMRCCPTAQKHLENLLNNSKAANCQKKTSTLTYRIWAEQNCCCYLAYRQFTKPKLAGGLAYLIEKTHNKCCHYDFRSRWDGIHTPQLQSNPLCHSTRLSVHCGPFV